MLDKEDMARLKEIFVTRQECQTSMDVIDDRVNKSMVRLSVIETKLGVIVWLLTAVCGGIIAMLVKMFFGG